MRACFREIGLALDNREGEKAAEMFSPATVQVYDRLVRLGWGGNKQEIARLSPIEKWEIILMRNRIPYDTLRKMDGKAYIIYAVNNDFWGTSDGEAAFSNWELPVGSVKTGPGWASADIIDEKGKKTGFKWDFIKVGDRWTFDWKRADAYFNQQIEAASRSTGTPIDNLLIENESIESGRRVRDSIFITPR